MSNSDSDSDLPDFSALSMTPYACTFLCGETFQTMRDWKRHENSQHYQAEVWHCDECGMGFYQMKSFEAHLTTLHGIDDITEYDIDACNIPPQNQTRFWCGFCDEVVELENRGLDAWTERFRHIGDHFTGQNGPKRTIEEWICIRMEG